MADIAAEIKETKAVGTPEKEVEKKSVEKEIVCEKKESVKATDTTKEEEESKVTNGSDKEAEVTENGEATEGDKCAIKRKSVGGGDATDGAVTETNGVSEEKKAKLDEAPAAENGEAKEAEATA